MESTANSHLGIKVVFAMGLMTVVAAAIAMMAREKRTEPQAYNVFDDWEEVLGI